MGVVVYTLVSVFLWPHNNAGSIRMAGDELLPESIQQEMLQRTKYWKKILE